MSAATTDPIWRAPRLPFSLTLALLLVLSVFLLSCETLGKVGEFLDSISDGAACTENFECLGGRCLTARAGYPGGYCTTLQCDKQGCSGFSSECFRTKIDNVEVAACYEMCRFDGSCRREAEGYACVVLEDVQVCLPPNATNATPQGAVGSGCTNDLQCGQGGTCLTNLFGGYCTRLGCDGSASCPTKSTCVTLNPDAAAADQVDGCLATCAADGDCRHGYACQTYQGSKVCVEADRVETKNPDGVDDGKTCVANVNCKGNTCIREAEGADGQMSFPGGYCTTRNCKDDTDCNGSSICISRERSTTCMASCAADSDCRTGYKCRAGIEGNKFCDSKVEYIAPDTTGANLFDIKCGASKALTFTVPAGAIGFYIAPFTSNSRPIKPTTMRLPNGSTLNIETEYKFHAINPLILESLAPILFPASNDARFSNGFGPGQYTLNVQSDSSSICYYMIPKMSAGTKLDVNIYLVGVPNLTAATAAANTNMKQVVQVMQSIYTSMNVQVRVANYVDPSKATIDNYSMLRDFGDIFGLVATSEAQGSTVDESLAVNVFLINDFAISEAPGLLGVSAGLPGMAGVHGNSGSGLVFSTASLGRDNATLGQTMAHEIGHFLGLRHTTEHQGAEHDPITDTPQCIYPNLGYLCSDAKNFMFPFSLGNDQRLTTPGQSFVVKRSPLVK
ncbi:MAG: hypothetical protein H0U74_21140 [Bradymonadaceae bacterium]|nr:hypothetical protein [Lujinxingiaceae bacterium]